jgi:hypothetical protein
MLLAYRLVRLIETHADKLAETALARVEADPKTKDYRGHVPDEDFKAAVREIYSHLGEWVMGKSEEDIASRYTEIGRRRASQGVMLSELNWAILLTRENLWEFLKKEDTLERPTEVFGELTLLQMLEQFFDRAIYYAAVGYEQHKFAEEKSLHLVK